MTLMLPPSRPPLRGSPKRLEDLKEAFQIGYVRAVAAAAGVVISGMPEIDEGIDLLLSHTSASHTAVSEGRVVLDVQLKATHTGNIGQDATVTMGSERHDFYATASPTIHKIVVIMRVPADIADWASSSHGQLRLNHCAYWVNLAGHSPAAGKTKRVTAPAAQIFNDVALCDIMERVGRGGAP